MQQRQQNSKSRQQTPIPRQQTPIPRQTLIPHQQTPNPRQYLPTPPPDTQHRSTPSVKDIFHEAFLELFDLRPGTAYNDIPDYLRVDYTTQFVAFRESQKVKQERKVAFK